jgi:hypothetical protein
MELDRPSSGLSLKVRGNASKTEGWHGVNWDYRFSYRLGYKELENDRRPKMAR